VAKRYGTDKLPETYLVVGGEVVRKFVGQTDWDNPEVRALIASRLAGGAQAGSGPKASGT
jgi:thioredoxin-like negative regulator of GroEL